MSKGSDHGDFESVTSSATSRTRLKDTNDNVVVVASKEQKRVKVAKWIMVLVLLAVATALCTATYMLFQKSEENEFNRKVSAVFRIGNRFEKN